MCRAKPSLTKPIEIINRELQRKPFTKLFGGGQAFMRLTDPDAISGKSSDASGIDIIASPPGKKLQNVLLLSGGEKALTALSLLVGIFQFQPAPVLHPGRSRRAARRDQRWPVRPADCTT